MAVLLSTITSRNIYQLANLLLMEKSLVIVGKNVGMVRFVVHYFFCEVTNIKLACISGDRASFRDCEFDQSIHLGRCFRTSCSQFGCERVVWRTGTIHTR
jgi:hypothetical protein